MPWSKAEPDDPILGRTVLGNYVVERLLGTGGMGAVYLLRNSRLDTLKAMKVMLRATDGEEMVARFEQEARVTAFAARESHRVVKVEEVGEFPDGIPWMLMEFLKGSSLDRVLDDRGPLDLATALDIVDRIADTMTIAHDQRIIHRDLKPPNVMLVREGATEVVKLLDFGVARVTGSLKGPLTTGRGALIGTPGYMSPEAAVGKVVDGQTDVFSLGVILCELLTGELPFPTPTREMALVNVIMEQTPRLAERWPEACGRVPDYVQELIDRALAKDPADRFTMAELHGELTRARDRLQVATGERPQFHSMLFPADDTLGKRPTRSHDLQGMREVIERISPAPPSLKKTTPMPAEQLPPAPSDSLDTTNPRPPVATQKSPPPSAPSDNTAPHPPAGLFDDGRASAPTRVTPRPPPPTVASMEVVKPRRPMTVILVAAASAVVLGVGLVFALSRDDKSHPEPQTVQPTAPAVVTPLPAQLKAIPAQAEAGVTAPEPSSAPPSVSTGEPTRRPKISTPTRARQKPSEGSRPPSDPPPPVEPDNEKKTIRSILLSK